MAMIVSRTTYTCSHTHIITEVSSVDFIIITRSHLLISQIFHFRGFLVHFLFVNTGIHAIPFDVLVIVVVSVAVDVFVRAHQALKYPETQNTHVQWNTTSEREREGYSIKIQYPLKWLEMV